MAGDMNKRLQISWLALEITGDCFFDSGKNRRRCMTASLGPLVLHSTLSFLINVLSLVIYYRPSRLTRNPPPQLKTSITVGVVGFPNVGKSSLINSLKRSKVANVGATPGVTRSMQEIQLDKNVKLLDCPGIVFSSAVGNEAAAALRNAVKVEKLEDPILPGTSFVSRFQH